MGLHACNSAPDRWRQEHQESEVILSYIHRVQFHSGRHEISSQNKIRELIRRGEALLNGSLTLGTPPCSFIPHFFPTGHIGVGALCGKKGSRRVPRMLLETCQQLALTCKLVHMKRKESSILVSTAQPHGSTYSEWWWKWRGNCKPKPCHWFGVLPLISGL